MDMLIQLHLQRQNDIFASIFSFSAKNQQDWIKIRPKLVFIISVKALVGVFKQDCESFVSSSQLQTQLLKTCCIESKPRLHSMLSRFTKLYSAMARTYVLTLFPNGNLSHTMVTLLTHHTRGVDSGVVALDTMDMMLSVIHFSNSITLGNSVCYLLCNHSTTHPSMRPLLQCWWWSGQDGDPTCE